jgi:hypothetical protein
MELKTACGTSNAIQRKPGEGVAGVVFLSEEMRGNALNSELALTFIIFYL